MPNLIVYNVIPTQLGLVIWATNWYTISPNDLTLGVTLTASSNNAIPTIVQYIKVAFIGLKTLVMIDSYCKKIRLGYSWLTLGQTTVYLPSLNFYL